MLPKQNRLPSFKIPTVIKKGKRFQSRLLTLVVYEDKTAKSKSPRFAIIVPTKVDKRAVKRNKLNYGGEDYG